MVAHERNFEPYRALGVISSEIQVLAFRMFIFPAIDLRGGRCVRLLQGKAEQETEYFRDPGEAARLWQSAGSEWVHVVDLDGAFSGTPANWESIGKIVATGMKVQLGGGMRSEETIQRAFDVGVARVVLGTKACESQEFVRSVTERFGAGIAVGIDARNGKVAIKGWVDTTDMSAIELAQKVAGMGVRTIIYTDISTDGMLTGPNVEAQREMLQAVDSNIIASGGVARREDVENLCRLAADYPNLLGVIVGKALYEGKVELKDLISLTGQSV
jgi:phosphoribosylformimino-5-aminoimidazole carboxamide ribotide isomerase